MHTTVGVDVFDETILCGVRVRVRGKGTLTYAHTWSQLAALEALEQRMPVLQPSLLVLGAFQMMV